MIADQRVQRLHHPVGIEFVGNIQMRNLIAGMNAGVRRPAPCINMSPPVNSAAASSRTCWIDMPVTCRCQPTKCRHIRW